MPDMDYDQDGVVADGDCLFSAYDYNDGEIHLYAVLDRHDRDKVLAQLRVVACEGPQEFFVTITQMKMEDRIAELETAGNFVF